MLDRYFTLEDPRRLEPAERELYVETLLDSKLLLRGFVDRIDVAPNGMIRVVDYKTGRSPGELFEAKALFQMKFYALVIWRTRGVIPPMLQLIYLGNGEMLRYEPDEARPARHRAQGRGDLGGDPAWPRRPATGARTSPGSAAGAPTRPSAPSAVALPRRCPSWRHCPLLSTLPAILPATLPASWTPTGISRRWASRNTVQLRLHRCSLGACRVLGG